MKRGHYQFTRIDPQDAIAMRFNLGQISGETMSEHLNKAKPYDHVNSPTHYNHGKIEVIDFIEDQGLCFNLGNAIKYICRCRFKKSYAEDLRKAIWYLERAIKAGAAE